MKNNYLKKIFMFLPLLCVFALTGCMTPQVELRLEYDKMVKTITADNSTVDEFTKDALNNDAKAMLVNIYDKAQAYLEKLNYYSGTGKTAEELELSETARAADQTFILMSSIPSGEASQSSVTESPYYIKDAKISISTFGFKVTEVDSTHRTADAHFLMTATGTATDAAGTVLKDKNNQNVTYTAIVFLFNPAALMGLMPADPTDLNLHRYKISADSAEIFCYNLIYSYEKVDGNWGIAGIKDSDSDIITDLTELIK